MVLAAIAIGTGIVAAAGFLHHYALMALATLAPRPEAGSTGTILVTFSGLLILHLLEILAFAGANWYLMELGGFGGPRDPLDWDDVIYLTGVNFTTLGYTQIELTGVIRLVTMLQALGGFMLLTWSATYLFSVCQRSWHRAEEE